MVSNFTGRRFFKKTNFLVIQIILEGRNPYAHVALEIKNKFENSYKDLPDTKFQAIKDYIKIIKNNPS